MFSGKSDWDMEKVSCLALRTKVNTKFNVYLNSTTTGIDRYAIIIKFHYIVTA